MVEWILSFLLILSSLGVIFLHKPVHAALSFLLTLMGLAAYYLQLSAEFIGVMQVLVYAGAIMVIFMFVVVLFQDAHEQIENFKPRSSAVFLYSALSVFLLGLLFMGYTLAPLPSFDSPLPAGFGTVQLLGKALYLDFFFPFEAVILLFLVAMVGALYVARREQ